MLEDARDAGRITDAHAVLEALAMRYADLVDRAARSEDPAGLLRAGEKLLELLTRLPVQVPGGGAAGDGGGDRARILSILDGGPTLGDAADG
jgi:hypothetical protein